MRRFLVFLVHLLIAAAIFGTVMRQKPLWVLVSPPDESVEVVGFHPERGTLVTIEGKLNFVPVGTWQVVERDRETGRELQRVTVHAPAGRGCYTRPVLLDGDQLLVMHGVFVDPNSRDPKVITFLGTYYADLQWEALDLGTGRRLLGPFACDRAERAYGCDQFHGGLAGRRWTLICRQEWDPGKNAWSNTVRVVSLADGKEVLCRTRKEYRTPAAVFAPDDAHVALIESDEKGKQWIVVYALPSGERLRAYELPEGQSWQALEDWREGEFILRTDLAPGTTRQERYSVAINGETLGAPRLEPHLYSTSSPNESMLPKFAGDHVIRVTHGQLGFPGWVQSSLRWLDVRMGTRWAVQKDITSIQVADAATGRVLGKLTWPEWCSVKVSPDLRRVARAGVRTGLQMWDLQPAPRWPWAITFATLPSALWYGVTTSFQKTASKPPFVHV